MCHICRKLTGSFHFSLSHIFLRDIGDSSLAKTLVQVFWILKEADRILSAKDFDGDDVSEGLGISVAAITIMTSPGSKMDILSHGRKDKNDADNSPETFLKEFSRYVRRSLYTEWPNHFDGLCSKCRYIKLLVGSTIREYCILMTLKWRKHYKTKNRLGHEFAVMCLKKISIFSRVPPTTFFSGLTSGTIPLAMALVCTMQRPEIINAIFVIE